MEFSTLHSPYGSFHVMLSVGSDNSLLDMTNAKLWFMGGNNYFSVVNAIPLGTWTPNGGSPWATNYLFLYAPPLNGTVPASFSGLEHADNYFWITYDISPGAQPGNNVDAGWLVMTLSALGSIDSSPPALTGNRLIYADPLGQ